MTELPRATTDACANPRTRGEPLIGRHDAVRRMRGALDDVLAGEGSSTLVVGAPGMGKSRFAAEVADSARLVHVAVLRNHVTEDGGPPVLRGWIVVLRKCLEMVGEETARRLVAEAPLPLRELFFEVRRSSAQGSGHHAFLAGAQARFELVDAAARIVFAAAEVKSCAVVIDDVDKADILSLQLLAYMGFQVKRHAIALFATVGGDDFDESHESGIFLERFATLAKKIELQPLTATETAQYVEELDAELSFRASHIFEATAGCPLLVAEALHWLYTYGIDAELPSVPDDLVTSRLHPLSSAARRTLEIAAVIGSEFDASLLAEASETDAKTLGSALEQSIAQGAVRRLLEGPDRLAFRHERLRDSVYRALPDARRRELHLRVAEAVERHAYSSNEVLMLAHHYFEALPLSPPDKAIEYSRFAGDAAMAVSAFQDAARFYERALAALEARTGAPPLERYVLLMAIARARRESADLSKATLAFLEAANLARRHDMAGNLARAALGLRTCLPLWEGGDGLIFRARGPLSENRLAELYRIVPKLLKAALERLPEGDRALRARLLSHLADTEPPEKQAAMSRKAIELAQGTRDAMTQFDVLSARLQALLRPDDVEELLRISEMILRLSDHQQQPYWAWDARWRRRFVFSILGERESALSELWELERIAEKLRHPVLRSALQSMEIGCALEEGRFADAERLLGQTDAAGERVLYPLQHMTRLLQAEELERLRGGEDAFETRYENLTRNYGYIGPIIRATLAHAYLDRGRLEEARTLYELVCATDLRAMQRDANWVPTLAYLATLAAALRDRKNARRIAKTLTKYSQRNAATVIGVSLGSVARYVGLLAECLDDVQTAETHFRQATAFNERMRARPQLALTRFDLARLLLRQRKTRERGLAELEEAAALSAELGMRPLSARIDAMKAAEAD